MSSLPDPYLYHGTKVLANKFGLRDQKRLDEVEANYTPQIVRVIGKPNDRRV